jgi:thioredoxin 1
MLIKKSFWRTFWLVTLVLSLGLAWYCYYSPRLVVNWSDNINSANGASLKSGKSLLVFVTAKWCVPCRIMKRTVLADTKVQQLIASRYTPLIVDFDDPAARDFIARYGIRGTPVTLLFDSNGSVVKFIEGGVGKDEFIKYLEK